MNAKSKCWEEWRKNLETNAAMIWMIDAGTALAANGASARTETAATSACYGATTFKAARIPLCSQTFQMC